MDDPSPTQQPSAAALAPARKFWTGPKIAGAVGAAWLFLMIIGSGNDGSAERLAAEEVWRDADPAGTILDPGYAAAEAALAPALKVAPQPEPSPEESGVSAKEMIETELSSSVVY